MTTQQEIQQQIARLEQTCAALNEDVRRLAAALVRLERQTWNMPDEDTQEVEVPVWREYYDRKAREQGVR